MKIKFQPVNNYLFISKNIQFSPTHNQLWVHACILKSWDFMCCHDPPRSWSNLQAYPTCSPTSRTLSSVIRTSRSDPDRIPAFPTMNSIAHSILKLRMKWTPSLIHPNKSTSGELTVHVSHAIHPSRTPRSRLIPSTSQNPMDLVLQAQPSPTQA